MTDPVTAINGETYERTALERLFKGKRRHGSKEQQVLQSLGPDRRLVQNWHAKVTIREVRGLSEGAAAACRARMLRTACSSRALRPTSLLHARHGLCTEVVCTTQATNRGARPRSLLFRRRWSAPRAGKSPRKLRTTSAAL